MSVNLDDFHEKINSKDYDYVSSKLREFCKQKGLIEVCTGIPMRYLSACENPASIVSYNFSGQKKVLPQTSQMLLEAELLTDPSPPGYFSYCTSYREEKTPIKGRHNLIFPMFEFELHGDMTALQNFEKELLEHLGYGKKDSFPEGNFEDICKKYGVDDLTHEHEQKLYDEYGPVFFLKNFPERTSPFFNMKRSENGETSNKIDVIMSGIETIGSAERSCDVEDMRNRFYSISDGQYAGTLFDKFGKEPVVQELEEFLSYKFMTRSGGGIGLTRLIASMKKEGLLPSSAKSKTD